MYCEGLMRYDAARAANAPTTPEVLDEAKHVQSSYDYALSVLDTCVKELNIPEDKVLNAQKEAACQSYTQFEVETAQDEDWITSKVAMIPCIQVPVVA